MRYTVTYERVTARRSRTGKCPDCGVRTKRSHTAEMTVSPFNKNPDGTVRTYAEVERAVQAKADEWVPDFRHYNGCPGGEEPA
jgi:hypothetical protein